MLCLLSYFYNVKQLYCLEEQHSIMLIVPQIQGMFKKEKKFYLSNIREFV